MILDLEAFDVLPSDVDDEIHIRTEVGCRPVVGDGLHDAEIHAQPVLHQLFTVAGNGGCQDPHGRVLFPVDLPELFGDLVQRLPLVGGIVGVQQLSLAGDEHQLCGGRACVHSQVCVSGVGVQIRILQVVLLVPLDEGFIFRPILKEPSAGHALLTAPCLLQLFQAV